MICFNCRKQIPDGSGSCPYCGTEIMPHEQVAQEVKVRRYQRWVLYVIIILVFLGMLAYTIKVYADNNALLEKVTSSQEAMAKAEAQITEKDGQLKQRENQINQLRSEAETAQEGFDDEIQDLRSQIESKTHELSKYEEVKASLNSIDANVYATLIELSVGVSAYDISRIPIAEYNFNGKDSDGDGLPDMLEEAIGTDINQSDTDNDGYNDKEEIINGYNPIGNDKLPVSADYANVNKGKIMVQVEQNDEAWYINPQDGKRYFLGRPADAIQALQKLGGM